jgi:hypothetical protein
MNRILVSAFSLWLLSAPAWASFDMLFSIVTADGSVNTSCILRDDQVDVFDLSPLAQTPPWKRFDTIYSSEFSKAQLEKTTADFGELLNSSATTPYVRRKVIETIKIVELKLGKTILQQGGQIPAEANGAGPGPGDFMDLMFLQTDKIELERALRFAFTNCLIEDKELLERILREIKAS